jgi:hypothetical protein
MNWERCLCAIQWSTAEAKSQFQLSCEGGLRSRRVLRVNWIEEKGRFILAPMTSRRIKEIMGFLKPKAGEPSMFEETFKERERERRREDLKFADYDREFEKKMGKAGKIMKRYRNTLSALAK